MHNHTYLQGGSGSEEPVPESKPLNPGHHDDDHVPLDRDDDAPIEEELSDLAGHSGNTAR